MAKDGDVAAQPEPQLWTREELISSLEALKKSVTTELWKGERKGNEYTEIKREEITNKIIQVQDYLESMTDEQFAAKQPLISNNTMEVCDSVQSILDSQKNKTEAPTLNSNIKGDENFKKLDTASKAVLLMNNSIKLPKEAEVTQAEEGKLNTPNIPAADDQQAKVESKEEKRPPFMSTGTKILIALLAMAVAAVLLTVAFPAVLPILAGGLAAGVGALAPAAGAAVAASAWTAVGVGAGATVAAGAATYALASAPDKIINTVRDSMIPKVDTVVVPKDEVGTQQPKQHPNPEKAQEEARSVKFPATGGEKVNGAGSSPAKQNQPAAVQGQGQGQGGRGG